MNNKDFACGDGVRFILSALKENGEKAYTVGGCVRDTLLGREPNDWDICTSALPERTAGIFRSLGCGVIETGLKHGTVTVRYHGENYEVTTFRKDCTYSDNRHPDAVEFVSDIKEDISRRDFTINAMAYAPGEDVIDPFGGQTDLRFGIIRCVGDQRESASRKTRSVSCALCALPRDMGLSSNRRRKTRCSHFVGFSTTSPMSASVKSCSVSSRDRTRQASCGSISLSSRKSSRNCLRLSDSTRSPFGTSTTCGSTASMLSTASQRTSRCSALRDSSMTLPSRSAHSSKKMDAISASTDTVRQANPS